MKRSSRTYTTPIYILYILAISLVSFSLQANDITLKINHLSLEKFGGPRAVTCFVEDKQGFLYIGTKNGLLRYDGHELKELKHSDKFGNISSLTIDSDNQIWIAESANIYTYNPSTETSSLIEQQDISNIQYRTIYATKNNEIVLGTSHGLRIYNKESEKLDSYFHQNGIDNSLSHNIVRSIYEDKNGILWIGTHDKLNKFDRQKNKFTSFDLKPEYINKEKNNLILVIKALEGDDNTLAIGTETGLALFDIESDTFELTTRESSNNTISNDVIKSFVSINKDEIWFGTDYGLNKYSIKENTSSIFLHDFVNDNSISNNVINTIYHDTQGNIWIGTDRGIDKVRMSNKSFLFNQKESTNSKLKGGVEVNSFAEDDKGNLWIASNEGLIKYDAQNDKYIDFYPPRILHRKINNIYIDKEGNVWTSSPGGVNKYLVDEDKFISFTAKKDEDNALKTNYIASVNGDNNGNIWISSVGEGLFKLYENNGETKIVHFYNDPNNPFSISGNGVKKTFIDKDGNPWIVLYNEINKLDLKTGKFEVLTIDSDISRPTYVSTYVDDDIYISINTGIYKWDYNENVFKLIHKPDGDIISFVVNGDKIWYTKDKNIYKYNLADSILVKIPSYETYYNLFNQNGYITKSKKILFSAYDGFISFDPEKVEIDKSTPNVFFTEFNIDDKNILDNENYKEQLSSIGNINNLKEIELAHDNNSFDISFSSLNLTDDKSVRYRYKLEGYDENWILLNDGSNSSNYTKVKPGNYIFKINAISPFNIPSDNYREIKITINRPYWASNTAIGIYLILILVLLFFVRSTIIAKEQFNHEVKFEKFQRSKSEELIEIKTKFFNNITHELKTPLTLIKAPIERMLESEEDKDKKESLSLINRNTDRLIKLVNQVLDIRKSEKGLEKLKIEEKDIVEFCRSIFVQFEIESKHRNITTNFYSETNEKTMWFDQEKLEKILLNLLSNAYKFTPDSGRITLKIKNDEENSKVIISVKDTGIGIKDEDKEQVFKRFSNIESENFSSQIGSGIGLSLVKDYVDLHAGSIEYTSEVNVGSVFLVTLPTNKDVLENYIDKSRVEIKGNSKNVDDKDISEKGKVEDKDSHLLLLVEDDKDMREFLQSSLSSKFNVVSAKDGEEGAKKALKLIPDIIISDVMMPNKNGYQLCEELKLDVRTGHIPIILLSARNDAESKLAGIEFGADDYIAKPFKLDYLVTKANKLIEQREKLKSSLHTQKIIEPTNIEVESSEEEFLKKVLSLIEENMDNSELNVKDLSDKLGMSHINFYRKIKTLTGQTATDFIRSIRLKRAGQLLKTGEFNVKDVMYMVGFTHRSYFSKCFKEYFGVSPKEFK